MVKDVAASKCVDILSAFGPDTFVASGLNNPFDIFESDVTYVFVNLSVLANAKAFLS